MFSGSQAVRRGGMTPGIRFSFFVGLVIGDWCRLKGVGFGDWRLVRATKVARASALGFVDPLRLGVNFFENISWWRRVVSVQSLIPGSPRGAL